MLRSIVQALRRPGTPTELKQFRAAAGVSSTTITSATVDFGSIAASARASLAITVPGVLATSPVSVSFRTALPAGISIAGVAVTGVNTVTVYAFNYSVAPVDPVALTADFIVFGA